MKSSLRHYYATLGKSNFLSLITIVSYISYKICTCTHTPMDKQCSYDYIIVDILYNILNTTCTYIYITNCDMYITN